MSMLSVVKEMVLFGMLFSEGVLRLLNDGSKDFIFLIFEKSTNYSPLPFAPPPKPPKNKKKRAQIKSISL